MDDDNSQNLALTRAIASGGPLTDMLLALWQRTRIDWGFVTDRLSQAFRADRSLRANERRMVAETLYGMVRHMRRIDAALAAGGLRGRPNDRARLLAYLVLEEDLPVGDAAQQMPDVKWDAVARIDEQIAREGKLAARLGLRHSVPDWLAAALVKDWGDEAEALLAAMNLRAPMTVRANRLSTTREALIEELAALGLSARPGSFAANAVHVDSRTNLFALEPFQRGAFEAQDEGSQLIAEAVAPPPRSTIIDFCAGAGGKTLALAADMENKGRIIAADVDGRKLNELRRRAKRAGATTIQAVELGEDWPKALHDLDGKGARVLVDAPCTGTGALRRNPEARWRLQPRDLESMPAEQLAILERAATLVAPGGRLIYATCSVLACENDRVVDHFLERHPGYAVMPLKMIWGSERALPVSDPDGKFLRTLPNRQGTDGFFAAALVREKA